MRDTAINTQSSPPLFSSPLHSSPLSPPLTQQDQKLLAAHYATTLIKPNTIIGLGTGSTASLFLHDLSLSPHLPSITGIPTSVQTTSIARTLKIPLSDLGSHPAVDISIDGADEVDLMLNLVKGRGGSLLREKMIEGASKEFVVIVDESKLVEKLGCTGAIPVEIVPFCWEYTIGKLKELLEKEVGFVDARLRIVDDEPFVTDNGNYIVNLFFEKGIGGDLKAISDSILRITGVIEHGIFIGMATSVIVAKKDGTLLVLNKE